MSADGAPDPGWIDAETHAAEADHRAELKLWLRLLTCTTLIETEVRRRLRETFEFTLPRFDLLAQLDKAPDGLVLGEVSKRLMVSAGNVTAIVDRLLESGHITRAPLPTDRRIQIIRLTEAGRAAFTDMAEQHGEWIGSLFAGVDAADAETLMTLLGRLKGSVRRGIEAREGGR